jgi:hypothetical protein
MVGFNNYAQYKPSFCGNQQAPVSNHGNPGEPDEKRSPARAADHAGIRSAIPAFSGRRHPTDANDSALSFSGRPPTRATRTAQNLNSGILP